MKPGPSDELPALVTMLRKLCAALPDAEEYVMVHHPAFRVGKKPFVIAGLGGAGAGVTVSVNLGRDAQPQLLDDRRFVRTPYIGQHGWVSVAYAQLERGELRTLVTESFRRVANRRQRAALSAAAPARRPR